MSQELQFAFSVTGPILFLLLLGYALKKTKVIDEIFVKQANGLIFNIALPVLLFFAISSKDITESFDLPFVASGVVGTLLLVLLLMLFSKRVPTQQRGVFIQGAYRGNKAIVAVALSVAAYGEAILPTVGVYIAVVTTIYNVFAVWVLNSKGALKRIVTNPIIIGIVLGSLVSLTNIQLPVVAISTGAYISAMTLPIALICVGANLKLSSLKTNSVLVSTATLVKLIGSPALIVAIGWMFGVRGDLLVILFFMSAAPTASASYVMAQKMTNSGELAAEIIAMTTAFSVISITIGMAVLRTL
ncbi:MAG: AEC family transporter [Granulosicoccaceae bacterium]